MLKQVTSLIIPKFIARKPKIKHGTYNKYGFVITLHQYCIVTKEKLKQTEPFVIMVSIRNMQPKHKEIWQIA